MSTAITGDQPDAGAPAEVDEVLVVDDLKVHYPIRSGLIFDRTVGHVKAVDGVDLRIPRGRTYGLVGESGCGKSTLGRALLRLEDTAGGSIVFDGTDITAMKGEQLRKLRRRMQMVFQDPMSSLDPRQSIQSLLVEPLKVHGLSQQDKEEFGANSEKAYLAKAVRMLELVGLPRSALAKYPHEFSGGQRQRIGIARAVILNPELVIADEPVSALDVSVQAQVINLLEQLQEMFGLTYVVIAHDLAVVRHISDTIGVMYLGKLVEEAPADDLYAQPLHPYTIALMSAIPVPDPELEDNRERILLQGDLPSPANPPSGCRFHTRCPWRQETRCDTEVPELTEIQPGRRVACHWAGEILSGEIAPRASQVAEPVEPRG
ncbi:peptide/nickel transport system ATP-binding protein/oligopeptide transport system ATP-binding protein [Propionibacteriaceae bacterium ES.041]|uniref:ABC transporter ATP-binding protein n=1 Tax=Enemella evansiae TaxID=2016499 RepID=UPI000B960C3C|nr:oligopeptide/dipeptide ABC transporter ATP-binding protein [Enemella evansiae]OYN94421.1 dipeptide/oligopeptide/nickel ABC transporter ATP-binding protein [Enemella evansiae]OYO11278.1 dipeptide/oligopeptide/nickel ABC transporter ATP-binding protein [Enemella evansiae]PFG66512.1 peptide/nickel transport system ATP-binding protein/oligopeptide transport system ATP-binding protein [Propionibacteriaceae bacterium ES.041]TDO87892.1 peptide/nickel transport system ATP-binding protein/oligopeptid